MNGILQELFDELSEERRTDQTERALEEFARFAESQLADDLRKGNPERVLRAALQTELKHTGLVFREAKEGEGQTDLFLVRRDLDIPEIVEAKIPKSKTEFEDGKVQLAQYAISRHIEKGF